MEMVVDAEIVVDLLLVVGWRSHVGIGVLTKKG